MGARRAPLEEAIESEAFARALTEAALEKKGRDPAILDMTNLVSYTDVFVLITATNRRQVQAIADEVVRVARKDFGRSAKGVEGVEAARWVLVDFGDVVVHIFDEPLRGFYNLDGLWGDAPRLPVPEVQGAEAEPLYSLP